MARMYRVRSTDAGRTTFQKVSEPSAGSVKDSGAVSTRSGVPSCQPGVKRGTGGSADGSPSGEPARCHA